MGKQLFRADFQRLEMHDYFFLHAGVDPGGVSAEYKSNRWRVLSPVDNATAPYVLFCPGASTPLRAIPACWHAQIIRELQQRYWIPVNGFSPQTMAGYEDLSPQITTSTAFINAISRQALSIRRTPRRCILLPPLTSRRGPFLSRSILRCEQLIIPT